LWEILDHLLELQNRLIVGFFGIIRLSQPVMGIGDQLMVREKLDEMAKLFA